MCAQLFVQRALMLLGCIFFSVYVFGFHSSHKATCGTGNFMFNVGLQVTNEVLQLLLTYCRYHRVPGHSDKERKAFDEKFIRLDTRRLCELTSAADRCTCASSCGTFAGVFMLRRCTLQGAT